MAEFPGLNPNNQKALEIYVQGMARSLKIHLAAVSSKPLF
jgi:hypothetical protein